MTASNAKLEKLTIEVYEDRTRRRQLDDITVMFNPTSFTLSHKTVLTTEPPLGGSTSTHNYHHSDSRQVTLELIFDGTGVVPGADERGSVSRQVGAFLERTMEVNGSSHEPNYLRLEWGDGPLQYFDCRLVSADVTYSLFDKNGAPLRATINATFREDLDDDKRIAIVSPQSPDVTHVRTVRAGDTLPLMCQRIYGSSKWYLAVARANDLDDIRNLEPGTELRFPPLTKT